MEIKFWDKENNQYKENLFTHIDDVDAFFDEWYEVYQEVRHSLNPTSTSMESVWHD